MSLQRIINVCESLNIDRRRVVGVQYTRSEIAKISQTPTRNPWRFNLGISAGLVYSENRDLLEMIDLLDRTTPEVISFNSSTYSTINSQSTFLAASPGLAYMFKYLGDNIANVQNINVVSFSGNQLVLGNLPTVTGSGGASAYMFRRGDFIQIKGYPHPFTSTTDVVRGTGTTITVTTHRPNFLTGNLTSLGINVGNQCQFKMFCPNMPTYKLTPGGANAIISWTSDFNLYEYTGDNL
jgi:hypothetical protein